MANEMQRGNLTGTAIMRIPISGAVNISGKQMKELRFMPYSEFPEEGREDVLYIDTDGNAMYYWDGTEYISLSGGGSGGTSNYNELSNKPSINDITLTGNKTSAELGLQPTISDLATIRSGAASGATAVQPSDMETALASKQDVIDDLSDIRTGAAAGETAVQPSALETALSEKQDVISDLADIRSGASAGATALQPEDIDTLPTDGSSNPVSSGGTYDFVNSSISTNTAYFIGTFASVAELEAYSGTVTNNDYAFVTSTDSAGNTLYNRYKYNAATQTWSFEYAVNNTAFTTAQWAAIQSGLTASDKTKLDGIEQGANKTVIDASPTSGSDNAVASGGVHTALSGKQDTISDLSDIRSGASAGATAVQPSALNDYQTKLSGTNKLDPSYIDYDASHRAVSDTEKSTWNGKQDAISDLDTIRSGAAAGATALQQSDVTSTYSASGTAPVNGTAVNAAIETLDVLSVGGSGKYISAIREEDGKIEATPTNFDTSLSSSSTNNNAPTSKTVFDDQQRQEVEIGAVANRGAKNLFKNTAVSKTYLGVTFTVNEDGTVSLSGAATPTAGVLEIGTVTLPAGSYIVSGCPEGGSWAPNPNKYRIRVAKNGAWLGDDTGSGYTVTVNGSDVISLQVNSGIGVDTTGLVFKPMIRPAAITDPTFVPYALPNPTLTPAVIKAVDEGSKNLYPPFETQSSKGGTGVTYSYSGGIVYAKGTKSSSLNYIDVVESSKISELGLKVGDVIKLYNTSDNLRLGVLLGDGTTFDPAITVGNEVKEVTIGTGKTHIYIRAQILSSFTGTVDFSATPMICKKSLYNISPAFVPYALPNPTLTPAAIKAVDEGAKNIQPVDIEIVKQSTTAGSWNGNVYTESGTTYTINDDGTITVDTTGLTKQSNLFLSPYLDISNGKWVVSGCPQGGTSETYYIATNSTSWSNPKEYGDGVELDIGNNKIRLAISVKVRSGILVFKPMLCTKAAWDVSHTYEPYALPNPTLTPALIKAADEGAKNKLQLFQLGSSNANVGNPCTSQGVKYEIQSDGTITAYRKSSASSGAYIFLYKNGAVQNVSEFFDGNHIWSGNPSQYPDGGVSVWYKIGSGSNITLPNGALLPNANGETVQIGIQISTALSPTQSNPIVFRPMICTAADWAVSKKFVPYRPSWQEMADKTAQIGLKLVKSQTVTSNTEVTYAMNMNDFLESSPVVKGSIGTYVISVMPWSTTPTFSLYTVSYTGGSFAYTSIVKIAGTDRTVTVSNGVISISGFPSAGAKVSIHAML